MGGKIFFFILRGSNFIIKTIIRAILMMIALDLSDDRSTKKLDSSGEYWDQSTDIVKFKYKHGNLL